MLNQKDPQLIVIDEIVGSFVANFFSPFSVTALLWSFALFRFFDVSKIFPKTDWNRCRAAPALCWMIDGGCRHVRRLAPAVDFEVIASGWQKSNFGAVMMFLQPERSSDTTDGLTLNRPASAASRKLVVKSVAVI